MMFIRDRMTADPITGHPEMSITDVQDLMIKKGFRHLPIIDEEGKMVGLITRSSLATALPPDTSSLSRFEVSYTLAKIKAQSVMIKDVITATPDTPIEIAARMMTDHLISCLPVMDGDRLAGIITDRDLFFTMVDLLGARNPGIRITVLQPDRTGEVARLTTAIAKAGGYLSVSVGYYPPDIPDHWVSVCKVQNIDLETLKEVVNNLEDTTIQDIRQFQEPT
jgi:acetoin utilization protein AcuB